MKKLGQIGVDAVGGDVAKAHEQAHPAHTSLRGNGLAHAGEGIDHPAGAGVFPGDVGPVRA